MANSAHEQKLEWDLKKLSIVLQCLVEHIEGKGLVVHSGEIINSKELSFVS